MSWSGYLATKSNSVSPKPCLTGILPLFDEKAATVSMMKHGFDIIKKATEFLNPSQVPITACDQPLFAIAKSIRWEWPDVYGENVHVVMLGGLHRDGFVVGLRQASRFIKLDHCSSGS